MRAIRSVFSLYKFCFNTNRDAHGSLHLHLTQTISPSTFESKLSALVEEETLNRTKAVWVYLARRNSSLLGIAFDKGFKIHHGKETELVLYRWIHTATDLVPTFSRFYVATGGIIIEDGKLLMVQEANGNRKDDWGIPGGLANMNEPLESATEREVLEETNLRVEFQYMVYIRELSNTFFDGTDLYFANYVKLHKDSLERFRLCQRELKGHEWVDLTRAEDFVKKNQVRNTQKLLLLYLSQLQKKGFRFEERKPNTRTKLEIPVNNKTKIFTSHHLIEIPK